MEGEIHKMTPKQRIAKMKAQSKQSWLGKPIHKCPGCGEEFRYINNLNEHKRKCLDFKYGKQKD